MTAIIVYEREVAEERSWYIGRYLEAFEKRGWETRLVCTDELSDYLECGKPKLCIMRVIDPVLSRELEEMGIRVANSSMVSRIANDKLAAYEYIKAKTNVPFPKVFEALELVEYPVVAKKRDGHGGTEVFFFQNREFLEAAIPEQDRELYVYQKPCSCPGRDVRVYVVGGQIIAAMERRNPRLMDSEASYEEKFRSNYCLGGDAVRYPIEKDERMLDYVRQITAVLDMDHAGIDFIFDEDGPVFNEIEDVVGSRMLYSGTDIDIVDLYVNYLVGETK